MVIALMAAFSLKGKSQHTISHPPFFPHPPGVGVGLFWRGEDCHSRGIFPSSTTQEAPLKVRASGCCSSNYSVCSPA